MPMNIKQKEDFCKKEKVRSEEGSWKALASLRGATQVAVPGLFAK